MRFSCANLGTITQDFVLAPYAVSAENGDIDVNVKTEVFYNSVLQAA